MGELDLVSLLLSVRETRPNPTHVGSRCPASSWTSACWLPHSLAVEWECLLAHWHGKCVHIQGLCLILKTQTLILHQESPVEGGFYSLMLSYTGFCILVSDSEAVPLGAVFQAALVCLAQLFAILYQPTSFFVTDFYLSASLACAGFCSAQVLCSAPPAQDNHVYLCKLPFGRSGL